MAIATLMMTMVLYYDESGFGIQRLAFLNSIWDLRFGLMKLQLNIVEGGDEVLAFLTH